MEYNVVVGSSPSCFDIHIVLYLHHINHLAHEKPGHMATITIGFQLNFAPAEPTFDAFTCGMIRNAVLIIGTTKPWRKITWL